ncbi:ribonucleoside hydrolase RihC [Polystyrenella longa]|uniref:Ribonucleoside hydrolase RihC n=1 Tax=Polystyrenella longa TaxID=2528007 RepID=A0A518CPB5_9PLAN|nr:nucleoside hydrolase [Polystyrenella longa]QDU81053.1 ribonucleoside hydrolase RihC [Polystyrenella longa]
MLSLSFSPSSFSMKLFGVLILTGGLLSGLCPSTATAAEENTKPVKLIFDTDMGNDIDDALALGVIHSLQSRGECELLAVTVSKDTPEAARFCDAINTFYLRGNIPIGIVRDGKTPKPGKFLPLVDVEDNGRPRYPHDITGTSSDTPEAYKLLRRVLAEQPDHSVAMVVVGFSTNIARLLESEPDEFSPLNGVELVAQKTTLLSMMAGHFGKEDRPKNFKEYNVIKDLEAARVVFEKWPTELVASGWEIGHAIKFPATSIMNDFNYVEHHPLKEGYEAYSKMPYDRPNWDLTSVLYAVRPDRGYFDVTEGGEIHIGPDDYAVYSAEGHGRHRHINVDATQIIRVEEALMYLASEPPFPATP